MFPKFWKLCTFSIPSCVTICYFLHEEFGIKTNYIINGCIGALDGWLVKIKSPKFSEVLNPGKYFSRKGFFALNVQAIVDKKKRILWRLIGEKGSAHDSRVFNESNLGKRLLETADFYYGKGLYIVGDSAYSLRSYLLTPYDNAEPGSKEDNFNFFLSSSRIYVECTFGEVDRRWGIFWRPLEGSLRNHQYTIDSALRLHNFSVDYMEELAALSGPNISNSNENDRLEREELNLASDDFISDNPFTLIGPIIAEGDVELRRAGRPTNLEAIQRDKGKEIRDKNCLELSNAGYARPSNARVSTTDRHNRMVEVREQYT